MDNGALTPDEMRQMFGKEPFKLKGVTDLPYMDFSKIPAGVDSTRIQVDAQPPPSLAA